MVDRFKKSFEKLRPPMCPRCRIDMTWYRSEMRPLTADLIDHHFHCVACGTTLIIPTNMKGETPGDKGYLSKPISPRAAFVRRGFIWAGTRVIRGQRKPLRSFIRTRS